MTTIAYIANTNNLLLTGLKSAIENTYINSAAVSVTVRDQSGTPVVGAAWPITLDYVAGSNGNYQCYFTADLEFLNGRKYTAYIDADGSDSLWERKGHWELAFTAEIRKS